MKRILVSSAVLTALSLLGTPTWAQSTQQPVVTAAADNEAFGRARKAYKEGDTATARTEMEKAIATLPDDVDANAWMGFVLVRTNDYNKAIPFLEKALVKKPGSYETMTNLGNALLLKSDRVASDTERALELFATVAENRPNSAEAQFNLGYAAARKNDYARAAAAYRKAGDLKPNDGQAFINLGIALQNLGKLDEAAQAMRTGISNNTGDKAAHAALGSIEVKRLNYTGAVGVLETARKLDSGNYGVLVNLAFAYSKIDRAAEGATIYGLAADLAASGTPGVETANVDARYNQGVLLAKSGNTDGALAAYEKALAIDPNYADALLNAGYLHFQKGSFAEAAKRFKGATALAKLSTKQQFVAWLNLGTALQRQQDVNGATAAWQKAASLDTTDYDVRNYIASALVSQGRDEEAAKVFKEMAELKPNEAWPQLALGLAAMKDKKLDDAIKAFRAAIKADPTSAQAHNNLGVVYERQGLLNLAMTEYKTAVQLDSELGDAKKNLARFGKMAETTETRSGSKPASKSTSKPTKKASGR